MNSQPGGIASRQAVERSENRRKQDCAPALISQEIRPRVCEHVTLVGRR